MLIRPLLLGNDFIQFAWNRDRGGYVTWRLVSRENEAAREPHCLFNAFLVRTSTIITSLFTPPRYSPAAGRSKSVRQSPGVGNTDVGTALIRARARGWRRRWPGKIEFLNSNWLTENQYGPYQCATSSEQLEDGSFNFYFSLSIPFNFQYLHGRQDWGSCKKQHSIAILIILMGNFLIVEYLFFVLVVVYI